MSPELQEPAPCHSVSNFASFLRRVAYADRSGIDLRYLLAELLQEAAGAAATLRTDLLALRADPTG
jgi:hypothetical protein